MGADPLVLEPVGKVCRPVVAVEVGSGCDPSQQVLQSVMHMVKLLVQICESGVFYTLDLTHGRKSCVCIGGNVILSRMQPHSMQVPPES